MTSIGVCLIVILFIGVGGAEQPHPQVDHIPPGLAADLSSVWRPDRWAPTEIDVDQLMDQLRQEAGKKPGGAGRDRIRGLENFRQQLLQRARHDVTEPDADELKKLAMSQQPTEKWNEMESGDGGVPAAAASGALSKLTTLRAILRRLVEHRQRSEEGAANSAAAADAGPSQRQQQPQQAQLTDEHQRFVLKRSTGRMTSGRELRRRQNVDMRDVGELHPVYLGMGPRAVGAAMMTMAHLMDESHHADGSGPRMSTRFIG